MKTTRLLPEIEASLGNAQNPRVQEIAKELARYGLAIAMPHVHEGNVVGPLPDNLIQYENGLRVSFRDKKTFESSRKKGFPVMWRHNSRTGRMTACAWCHDE
jgi:hypothetical protein